MGDPNSAWPKLLNDAIAGNLVFDESAAPTLAGLCASMVYVFEQVEFNASEVQFVQWFSTQESGKTLAAKFSRAGRDLMDRLAEHKKILEGMGETFIIAGKMYKDSDDTAAEKFNLLKSGLHDGLTSAEQSAGHNPRKFVPGKVEVPKWNAREGDKYPELSDKLKALAKKDSGRDTTPIKIEEGSGVHWDEYYAHKLAMVSNIPMIQHTSELWAGAASMLSTEFVGFTDQTSQVFLKGMWSGGAAVDANAAMANYVNGIDDLTTAMGLISENLATACGMLNGLQGWLPLDTEANCKKSWDPDLFKSVYKLIIQEWNTWYTPGIQAASGAIPLIPVSTSFNPANPNQQIPGADPKKDAPGADPKKDSPGAGTPKKDSPGGGDPSSPGTPTVPTETKPTETNPTNPTNPTDTTSANLSTITSALTTLAQDGTKMVESLASQASTLIQSLVSSQTGEKSTDTTSKQLEQQLASLLSTGTTPTDSGSPAGSPKVPSGTPGGTPATTRENPQTRLFPRAVAAEVEKTETATTSRAGLATGTTTGTGTSAGTGMGGSPMGSAGAGQGSGKEHKRPEFLKSGEHLDGVFDGIPEAVTPVAEK